MINTESNENYIDIMPLQPYIKSNIIKVETCKLLFLLFVIGV